LEPQTGTNEPSEVYLGELISEEQAVTSHLNSTCNISGLTASAAFVLKHRK